MYIIDFTQYMNQGSAKASASLFGGEQSRRTSASWRRLWPPFQNASGTAARGFLGDLKGAMTNLRRVSELLDDVNRRVGVVIALLTVPLVTLVVVDTIARRWFHVTLFGVRESVGYIIVSCFSRVMVMRICTIRTCASLLSAPDFRGGFRPGLNCLAALFC